MFPIPAASPHVDAEESGVVEVSLLLSFEQAEALTLAAQREGLSAAQTIRRLIHRYLLQAEQGATAGLP